MDYSPFNGTISFPVESDNGTIVCTPVRILDDRIFEELEYFLFDIIAVEQNVHILGSSSASVHIYDDDGMFFIHQ